MTLSTDTSSAPQLRNTREFGVQTEPSNTDSIGAIASSTCAASPDPAPPLSVSVQLLHAELSALTDPAEIAKRYKPYVALVAADDDYRFNAHKWPKPQNLLPNSLMRSYERRVARALKRGEEPSISSDLLALYEGLEKQGDWERYRRMDMLDAMAGILFIVCPQRELNMFSLRKVRGKQRRWDLLWLDDLWSRCVAFEAKEGIRDEDRVRERFRRFPFGVFSTVEERDEAERREKGFA
ncbi:hypothetical protein JCM6882_008663 [Rhodosporidiobolus microsporus]